MIGAIFMMFSAFSQARSCNGAKDTGKIYHEEQHKGVDDEIRWDENAGLRRDAGEPTSAGCGKLGRVSK
jgi:hypothetical protein